jgi:hypothetical protein
VAGPPTTHIQVPAETAAAAHAAPPGAGGIFRKTEECDQLPNDPVEHQRNRCRACVTESPPHHFDLNAPFGTRCRGEGMSR